MPPKAAAKKPAVLAAEALESWTKQEGEWFKAKIVLQHSLLAARRYLEREQQSREDLVDRIQREADHRRSHSARSEERRRTALSASREFQHLIQQTDNRIAVQQNLIQDAHDTKEALEVQLRSRRDQPDEVAYIKESVEKVEGLLERLRKKVVHLRRREALALTIEKQVCAMVRAAAVNSPYPFSLNAHHVVVLGGATEATKSLTRDVQVHAWGTETVVTHVLGSDPQWPYFDDTSGLETDDAALLQRARQCVFATRLGVEHPTPALHIADVLRHIVRSSDRATWTIVLSGSLADPSQPTVLSAAQQWEIDLVELMHTLQPLKRRLRLIIDARSAHAQCRGWSVFKDKESVQIWRHRLVALPCPDPAAVALAATLSSGSAADLMEHVKRGVRTMAPFPLTEVQPQQGSGEVPDWCKFFLL